MAVSVGTGIGWRLLIVGKRSDFQRKPRDFYPTPFEAVGPLIQHLPGVLSPSTYYEPCCGDGSLIWNLGRWGFTCIGASDIEPKLDGGATQDARLLRASPTMFITNPPWDRPVLHAIIDNLKSQAPTWLLIDADWMHTKQASPYLKYCRKIVSIGRVKWIPGSKNTGKDNCCWYLFDRNLTETIFIGR